MTNDRGRPPILGRRLVVLAALTVALGACDVALKPGAGSPARRTRAKGAAVAPVRATPTPTPTGPTPRIIPTLVKLPVPTFDVLPPLPLAPTEAPPVTPRATAAPSLGAQAAPVSPPSPAPPPTLRAGTVPLERRGDLLVARAQLGAREVGAFLLDTGAGATFIDQRLADELALPEIIPASAEGDAAKTELGTRELLGLAIGGLPLSTTPTFAVDLARPDAPIGGPFAGVIGFPTLGSGPFTLDFTAGTLTVHDETLFEPPPDAAAEVLRLDQGLPFVEAKLEDGSPIWLLLDTTAPSAITVWHGFGKQHPGVLHGAGTPGSEAELRSLRLFGSEEAVIPVLIQDAPTRPWPRARVVGRVGMEYLRRLRLTIHPGAQKIWAERP